MHIGTYTIVTGPVSMVPIDLLVPHPENPRQGDVGAICESIKAHGFWGAIIFQATTNRILVGEHRWRAAKELGFQEVPAMPCHVEDAEARRIMLADNQTSNMASWNDSMLQEILVEEHAAGTLESTGFDAEMLDALTKSLEKPLSETFADTQEEADSDQGRGSSIKTCPKCGYQW